MRKQTIFSRILLPTIVVLLLLPPLSCLIFRQTADKYAYTEAVDDLEVIQQNILPLMESCFNSSSNTETPSVNNSSIDISDTSGVYSSLSGQVRTFLIQISSLMRKMGGNAQLMIFESRMRVIYPYDEQEQEAVSQLATDFTEYIQENESAVGGGSVEIAASNGTYLVNIYEVPTKSAQVKYIVAYSSVSEIGSWVQGASILVLVISSIFVLLTFVVLWLTTRSITQPIQRLCREADQIGNGRFIDIEPSFPLKELENLRLAMNQMSSQLLRSDEVQRDFFQNVSHELRNPLMSISGYAQGIEQGVFRSPKEAAHTILEESGRLTELVTSLLTLSRLESEPNAPMLSSVRIIDTVEDCLDRINGLALKKGITVSLLPFNDTLCACGDEDLICKVLENLLTNAIRYAKTAVIISVTSKDELLSISVADDGTGISQKDLPHLFERCYKGENGNFGIGLAIARSATQIMGGKLIAANSELGGAIFTLSLKK